MRRSLAAVPLVAIAAVGALYACSGESKPETPPPEAVPVYAPAYTQPAPPPPPPQRFAHTINTYTGPPPIPPGHVYKPVVVIKPAADPNITLTWETSVPRR